MASRKEVFNDGFQQGRIKATEEMYAERNKKMDWSFRQGVLTLFEMMVCNPATHNTYTLTDRDIAMNGKIHGIIKGG